MSKQILSKIQLFSFLVLLCLSGIAQEKSNPFYSYNFGGLENYSPEKQITLLQKIGYDGICLQMAKAEHVNNLDRFLQAADKYPEFNIYAAFVRYNFQDSKADKNRWKTVVDKIEDKGIALWFIFGKPQENFGDEYVEKVLRKVVDYAAKRNVPVVLYPHSRCYFYSAEQALPLVKKINHPNLTLAVHTCHEQRAGNGHRLAEVVKNVKEYLSSVTIAGADKEVDRTSPLTIDKSTIQPLQTGAFDYSGFLTALKEVDYRGAVGFNNFKIDKKGDLPEDYLPETLVTWQKMKKKYLNFKK